jgi:hypothetical protein
MARIDAFFKLMAEQKRLTFISRQIIHRRFGSMEIWFAWIIPRCKMTTSGVVYEIAHDLADH